MTSAPREFPRGLFAAAATGIDLHVRLAENDAFSVFDTLGDLVVTGRTRTNINDFRAILIEAAPAIAEDNK